MSWKVAKLLTSAVVCRRQAHLCVLANNCTEPMYTKLVEALCAEHSIPLMKVDDNKKLGEWVGLCKIDKDGKPRKVVGCSCVVVKVSIFNVRETRGMWDLWNIVVVFVIG